jgi:hypothetical protein
MEGGIWLRSATGSGSSETTKTPDKMTVLPLTETELANLNPGIRSTVQTLRKWGFNTTDSGDGSTAQYDCDLTHPYVHIIVTPEEVVSEADRLVSLLNDVGVNFDDCPHPQDDPEGAMKHPSVEVCYLPLQGRTAAISLMNVILGQNDTVEATPSQNSETENGN